jgi:uncharacterized protein DUF3224
MTETVDIRFEIASWDEKPYRELPDGQKFARADVVLGSADGGPSGTFEGLMYYAPDGTGTYLTMMRLDGPLGGREGSFVLQGDGAWDGTTARGASRVVEGSGTGELAGITGSAVSVSTHADYPFMPLTLTYSLG